MNPLKDKTNTDIHFSCLNITFSPRCVHHVNVQRPQLPSWNVWQCVGLKGSRQLRADCWPARELQRRRHVTPIFHNVNSSSCRCVINKQLRLQRTDTNKKTSVGSEARRCRSSERKHNKSTGSCVKHHSPGFLRAVRSLWVEWEGSCWYF